MSDSEQRLICVEKLDRSSPELWPEAIPGVTEYAAKNSLATSASIPKSLSTLHQFDSEDYNLLSYYSYLSTEMLISEVKKLHDVTYKLGLEEAQEMTRGKFLNILPTSKRKKTVDPNAE